jgi:hypothetical protein
MATLQMRSLVGSRGKVSNGKNKKPNAIQQQKTEEKEVQQALKQKEADAKSRKHQEEADRKRAIREERRDLATPHRESGSHAYFCMQRAMQHFAMQSLHHEHCCSLLLCLCEGIVTSLRKLVLQAVL